MASKSTKSGKNKSTKSPPKKSGTKSPPKKSFSLMEARTEELTADALTAPSTDVESDAPSPTVGHGGGNIVTDDDEDVKASLDYADSNSSMIIHSGLNTPDARQSPPTSGKASGENGFKYFSYTNSGPPILIEKEQFTPTNNDMDGLSTPDIIEEDLNDDDISSDDDEEENYIVLDLHNKSDLSTLDTTFNTIINALNRQKSVLASKFTDKLSKLPKGEIIDKKVEEDGTDNIITTTRMKHSLLIDLKHIIQRIEKIGMLEGKKFEELEREQNEAIKTLSSIVDLEEEARISRNKAIEIQKETEREMAEIDAKKKIVSDELKQAEPDLLEARLAVEDISDRALNELVSLKKPPSTVSKVLTVAVWIVNSVPQDLTSLNDNSSNKRNSGRNLGSRGSNKPRHRAESSATNLRAERKRSSAKSGRNLSGSLSNSNTPRGRQNLNSFTSAKNSAKSSKNSSKNSSRNNSKSPSPSPRASLGVGDAKIKSNKGSINKNAIKRGRSLSTGLDTLNNDDNKNRRSKTPSPRPGTLAPLNETSSESRPRAKSKGTLAGSNNNNNNNNNNSKRSSAKLTHKKSGSRIDQLKMKDFNKILKQEWKDTRVMLTRGKFKQRVLEFDPKKLPKKVCARIEKEFLTQEDFTVLRANEASKVLGPLVKWIRSLVGYTTIWYRIEPLANEVKRLQMAMDVKKLEVRRLKYISINSDKKVKKIRSRMLRMVGYHKIGKKYFKS